MAAEPDNRHIYHEKETGHIMKHDNKTGVSR